PGVDRARREQFDLPAPQRRARPKRSARGLLEEGRWKTLVLVVAALVSGLLLGDALHSGGGEGSAPTAAVESSGDGAEGPVPDGQYTGYKVGDLPHGGPLTETASGKYRTVGEPGQKVGKGEKVFTYVVEVEDSIDSSTFGGDGAFAAMVDATLANPKGWTHDPKFAFQHITETNDRHPDLRIQLSTQKTTADTCGAEFAMETSCFYSDGGRVVLNEGRWVRGALPFEGDLGGYRQYMISHEVGHGIGFANHQPCEKNGALAPVMMQQTLSLNNRTLKKIEPNEVYGDDDTTCRPNPWPFPLQGR
ncbi:DUF3152 domain-containing protein, partial [Corynebacterium heidelbergense]